MLFVGPSSAGKTTMSRAFAADLNGVSSVAELGSDYKEINGTDQRSIEDIRNLIQVSKYKPRHKKRIIVIDEFQGVLSNAQAAACFSADTRVYTENGPLRMDVINNAVGLGYPIRVWSFNHSTHTYELKPVVASRKIPNTKPCVSLRINNSEAGAIATEDHLIYDPHKGEYVPAKDLNTALALRANLTYETQAVEVKASSTAAYVFDIQVADNENFFVVVSEDTCILAHNCLLKPLEEPSPDTLWILCTMDPSKLGTGNGRAIANRCTQFVLEPHTEKDLKKQCIRIIKREKMLYAKDIIDDLVQNCNGEMRTLANLLQAVQQYAEGMPKLPKKLKAEDIAAVLQTTSQSDEMLAVDVLTALYERQFTKIQRSLLDVQDGFRFVSLLLQGNLYLLNSAVLKGQKHSKLAWWSKTNKELASRVKGMKLTLGTLAHVNEALVHCKIQAANHALPAEELLSATLYRVVKELQ